MQVKFFTIPVFDFSEEEYALNKFLRSHRILRTESHFCPENGGYWAWLVEYSAGDPIQESPPANRKERKDPSKDLSEKELERFNQYKKIRKSIADSHSIPAYLVFTDSELATLARLPWLNADTVKDVKGVAPSHLKDFVEFFYSDGHGETSGASDGADSDDGEP